MSDRVEDKHRESAAALELLSAEKITHRSRQAREAFVSEGLMLALPLAFPGVTSPIPADESHITAFASDGDHTIYGGTSVAHGGEHAHGFATMLHGVTGASVDFGPIPGATNVTAITCLPDAIVFAANGPAGARLVTHAPLPVPFDMIQEWFITLPGYRDLGEPFVGETLVDLVPCGGDALLLATETRLLHFNLGSCRTKELAACPNAGAILKLDETHFAGICSDGRFWRYDSCEGTVQMSEPFAGDWQSAKPQWSESACRPGASILLADAAGMLYELDAQLTPTGRKVCAPFAPVLTLATTPDGRVFGFCGEGIARLFVCESAGTALQCRDLGVAVSTVAARRYGYQFGAALTGRDGFLVFGEADNLGHLWLYFPRYLAGSDELSV